MIRRSYLALAGLLMMASAAGAERFPGGVTDPLYQAECGSCHVAYPPELLPARSWEALLAGLDHHFGVDAGLDGPTLSRLRDLLVHHAGRADPHAGPVRLRITQTRWFQREHQELPRHVWRSPKVGSPANCGACHRGADEGDYDEQRVSLPR